jgi:hypothetical protein
MQEKPGSPGFSYLAGYPCVNVFASGVRERPVRFKKKKKKTSLQQSTFNVQNK